MAEEAQRVDDETPNDNAAGAPAPEERLAQLEAEIAKLKDEHLRALAEVENTRRRGERQAQEAKAYAIDRFARDLLPVADTMSRALGSVSPEVRAADEAVRNLFEGVELTERALIDAFTRHGLKRLGERGDRFDPNLHQAVAQIPSETPAGAIAEVMQVGFALNERTLRPAMVAVSTGPSALPETPNAPDGDGPPSPSIDIKV